MTALPVGGTVPRSRWSNAKGRGRGVTFLRAHVNHAGDDCVLWPMSRDTDGYGTFGLNGRSYKAHRWMCAEAHGTPPTPDHEAAHSCGNGHLGCVNPRHLSWMTREQNQQDRVRHGRGALGGRIRKLTDTEAAEVRAEQGKTPVCHLAARYGVSRGVIRLIHLGETYNTKRRDDIAAIMRGQPMPLLDLARQMYPDEKSWTGKGGPPCVAVLAQVLSRYKFEVRDGIVQPRRI